MIARGTSLGLLKPEENEAWTIVLRPKLALERLESMTAWYLTVVTLW